MALREIYADSTGTYADSVEIPTALINKYLEALSAIYSLDDQLIDEIFNDHNIHASPNVPYKEISMNVEGNYAWIENYRADSVVSGNPQFDSIVIKYDFKLQSYRELSTGVVIMTISTPKPLNLMPLVASLDAIKGLEDVEGSYSMDVYWDSTNIEFSSNNDTLFVDFSLGWRDCPSGCLNRHYWSFAVHGCNATFLGVITGINEEKVNVFPNPASNTLTIDKWDEIDRIEIFNMQGKLMLDFDQISHELDVSSLKAGPYLLRIHHRNSEKSTIKLIKR